LEARQQPLALKRGRSADGEWNLACAAAHLLNRRRQAIKAVAQTFEAGLTGIGEQDLAVEPAKQRDAQPLLEPLDLMADGCRRHVQLGGGLADAQMARSCLESTQRVQGRQSSAHSAFRIRYSKPSTEK